MLESEESKKAEHALNQNTRVNWELLNEKTLRERIDSLGEDIQTNREIWKCSREILAHRDGTVYEDLAFVDTVSHRHLINKGFDYYDKKSGISKCIPNAPMRTLLKESNPYTIIGIHNHPHSHIPSKEDIYGAFYRKYKYGLILAHNGYIFKYSIDVNTFCMPQALFVLDLFEKAVYNEDERKISIYTGNLRDNGVVMEVLR